MQITRPLAVLTLALSLATGGIAIAETQSHDDHAADVLELVLNDGAKWQGDQNMLTGMDAIHAVITTNLDAVHAGTASPEAIAKRAADVQAQLDFMIENCVLEPDVDEQFHHVLGQVMDGVATLEEGEAGPGTATIIAALNAYGEHFNHPGWQIIN